jgi:hypothetical protein
VPTAVAAAPALVAIVLDGRVRLVRLDPARGGATLWAAGLACGPVVGVVTAAVAVGVLGSGSVDLSAAPLAVVALGVAAERVGTARWARADPPPGL